MCFSAEASFAVGAALLPAGIYCIQSASPRLLALSVLPFLFSIQQCCEGLVWVGLDSGDMPLARGAALVFLFFALVFWPCWVPFSVSFLEDRKPIKQFLSLVALLAVGLGWALYTPLVLDSARLSVGAAHHSIRYDFTVLPAFDVLGGECWRLLYLASICCPVLVSLNRHFMLFAISLAVSAGISHLVFWYAFESVWCFFAAALSLQLCHAFRELPLPREGARPQFQGPAP